MKSTKLFFILILFFTMGNIADAGTQSWLKRLGEKAENAAKRNVERKVEEATGKAVDKAFDKAEETAQKSGQKREGKTAIIEPEFTDTPAENPRSWDDGAPYHLLKKGTRITYTFYDGKGKVLGYSQQEIIDITLTKNSVNAVVSGTQTDRKGKVQGSGTVALRYSNGNFYVDLLNMLSPNELRGINMDAKVTGQDLIIPAKLTPGQILPDASATFKMKMQGGGEAFDLPPLTFRVFNRRAVQAESVDTPMGKFVCFKIIQTVEGDYPIIGVQASTSITWIGKGIGSIKTETYDKKGNLQSRMLLTEVK